MKKEVKGSPPFLARYAQRSVEHYFPGVKMLRTCTLTDREISSRQSARGIRISWPISNTFAQDAALTWLNYNVTMDPWLRYVMYAGTDGNTYPLGGYDVGTM